MGVLLPQGSIYLWMYDQGLKGTPIEEIVNECRLSGVTIREKDFQNYYNGLGKRTIKMHSSIFDIPPSKRKSYYDLDYSQYPMKPFNDYPDTEDRWVPCSKDNKPMIKWGDGCLKKEEAEAFKDQVYLAENLIGGHRIVIDCDGDHDANLDLETIEFFWQFSQITEVYRKPKDCIDYGITIDEFIDLPASFHLTFYVDRVIPTMHFPHAHIDIIGNKKNSLRYFKNKKCNNMPLCIMNDQIWSVIREYIRSRDPNVK